MENKNRFIGSLISIYGSGFAQGAAFVLIPSLGKILAAPPYFFSSSAYGILYLPEIAGAVLSALMSGWVQPRYGTKGVFRSGIFFNSLAMLFLTAGAFLKNHAAYDFILAESLFLGIGFGFTLAAVNPYAETLFPKKAASAITILNGVIGGATAVSPLILHESSIWNWGLWPAVLGLLFLIFLLLPVPSRDRAVNINHEENPKDADPKTLWSWKLLFTASAVLIYAVSEGTFGSWANVYVSVVRNHSAYEGAFALSVFWGSMTVFRFFLALISDRLIPQRVLYLLSPLGIGVCFFMLPHCYSSAALIAAFAAAGACCSIYYPFSMEYGLSAYPGRQTQLAGFLVAALLIGEGIGSSAPGPLQSFLPLSQIYLISSLWAIPLFLLAEKIC